MNLVEDVRAQRHDSGTHARLVGRDFEAWLSVQHRMARLEGVLAHCVHVSPRIEFVRRGKKTVPVVVGDAVADFTGVLCDGRGLVVEAKSRSEGSKLLYKSELEQQQREQLDAYAEHGGVALLAVEFRAATGAVRAIVPWQRVPWRARRSALAIGVEDVTAFVLRPSGSSYLKTLLEAA